MNRIQYFSRDTEESAIVWKDANLARLQTGELMSFENTRILHARKSLRSRR